VILIDFGIKFDSPYKSGFTVILNT